MALPPTTGAPLDLYLPPYDYGTNPGDDTWDVPANDNWNTLNSFAGTVVLLSPTTSQTINQPVDTYLGINSLQAIGTTPAVRFGVNEGVWDASISRTATGVLSADTTTPGNAQGIFNASGYQVNGAAPNNYILVGDGTKFVASATLPTGAAKYQEVEAAGTLLAQRGILNFLVPLMVVDDSGNNSTDIGLSASGVTAGSYTAPTITVDTYGRITAATTNSLSRVTNANGSYIRYPDGTLEQWGTILASGGSGSDHYAQAITFPVAFTDASSISISQTLSGLNSGAGQNNFSVGVDGSPTTAGYTASLSAMVYIGGSGSNLTGNEIVNWRAIGW